MAVYPLLNCNIIESFGRSKILCCHRPQGRPQACMGPAGGSWDVICTSVQSCMYRSLSLDYQYQSTTFTDIMLKSTYYSRIKCSMLFGTYYAQNYASIIRPGLMHICSLVPRPPPQLSSLAVRITLRRQATITAVKDWERGYATFYGACA